MLEHQGDLYNHESLVAAIKSADVVISAVGYAQLPDQTHIMSAIKEAGNVKVICCTSMEISFVHIFWFILNALLSKVVFLWSIKHGTNILGLKLIHWALCKKRKKKNK